MLQWFDSNNSDSAETFLERAETFLQKGVKGITWGAFLERSWWNVIETNSYVVFLRMGSLAALLLREYSDLRTTADNPCHQQVHWQEDSEEVAQKPGPPRVLPLRLHFTEFDCVEWPRGTCHWQTRTAMFYSEAHFSEIVCWLHRACLSLRNCLRKTSMLSFNLMTPLCITQDVCCFVLLNLY